MHDNAILDMPTLPIEQEIQPRPCPRPRYQIPAPMLDETDTVTDSREDDGPQLQVRGAPTVSEMRGEARTVVERKNGAENGCHYPRRSNHTNLYFKQGIDA